jgi:hypothetical protein
VRDLWGWVKKKDVQMDIFFLGGEEEIRTLGEFYPTPLFESGTFNHSDTSPGFNSVPKNRV